MDEIMAAIREAAWAERERDVPEGCRLFATPDPDWRVVEGKPCRYPAQGHTQCKQPSAAELHRGTYRKQWWAYCPPHMYGRWVEDGQVMRWILRELTAVPDSDS